LKYVLKSCSDTNIEFAIHERGICHKFYRLAMVGLIIRSGNVMVYRLDLRLSVKQSKFPRLKGLN